MNILEKIDDYLEEIDLSKAKPAKLGEIFYANGGIFVGKFKGKKIYVAPEKYEVSGNHKKAESYCEKFEIKGLDTNFKVKWKLPSIEELKFIASTGFGNFKPNEIYWSSDNVGGVNFSNFRFKDQLVSSDEQKTLRLIRPICYM